MCDSSGIDADDIETAWMCLRISGSREIMGCNLADALLLFQCHRFAAIAIACAAAAFDLNKTEGAVIQGDDIDLIAMISIIPFENLKSPILEIIRRPLLCFGAILFVFLHDISVMKFFKKLFL